MKIIWAFWEEKKYYKNKKKKYYQLVGIGQDLGH